MSGKKKKPKQQPQASSEGAELEKGSGSGRGRDRARGGRGGAPRLRGRGRGRDNKENVEEDADVVNGSRGRGFRGAHRSTNGPVREGSRGGRGGRGGFRGARSRGPLPSAEAGEDGNEYPALTKVEPWNNEFPPADDWDNEEYIGSLAETKVFTPSQATGAPAPSAPVEALPNGSPPTPATVEPAPAPPVTGQVHYPTNNAQQGIDLNALLQKTSGIVVSSAMQQPFLQYGQPEAIKAAMMGPKSAKPLRPKIPSKIPSSAVEMPDDAAVAGLDVKFGTLDFGIEPSGFEIGLEAPSTSASGPKAEAGKAEYSGAPAQPPAASSLPKPDASLSGFVSASGQAQQQQSVAQTKTATPASYPYGGASYAPPTSAQATTAQPAGAYPSSSQTSAGTVDFLLSPRVSLIVFPFIFSLTKTGGVYSNSGSASTTYQGASNQTGYGAYGQQQSQQQAPTSQAQTSQQQAGTSTSYQAYNKIATSTGLADASVSNLRDLPSTTAASSTSRAPATASTAAATANKPAATTTLAAGGSGLPNMPPGVPMLGPGSFIMGQAPALPYYAAAAAAAGMQQHPMYSIEEMQYRYPHLAGYYDMGYQSPTSLGTAREGTLASLAYAGSDAKFSRNENNSPVPTSLSQVPYHSCYRMTQSR